MDLCWQIISLLFTMLSRLVTAKVVGGILSPPKKNSCSPKISEDDLIWKQSLCRWSWLRTFFIFSIKAVFIHLWLCWVFMLFSSCSNWELLSSCGAQASHCGDFSCCRAQALGHVGFSSCGSQALKHRLNSRGAQVQLLHGMWDLPRPGMEPVSAALAGGFFTTEPPGKPS